MDYSYFDESYYQEGSKRGTAYVNYREGARNSQTFRELASAIREVFSPKRVLDVGCATGTTVRLLNEMGCEAYGIDVSEWAVHHAEHPNVQLASADRLPFPDDFFDLVISCHALEHIPDSVFENSLKEIARVSSAFQFHLLPMVGCPPYDGDPEGVRQMLRKDPTHQQLHTQETWTQQFGKLNFAPLSTFLAIQNETETAELSIGQLLFKKTAAVDDSGVLRRSKVRNQRIFRNVQMSRRTHVNGSDKTRGNLRYWDRGWKEIRRSFQRDDQLDLENETIYMATIVEGAACDLRIAAGQANHDGQFTDVGEYKITVQPGCSVFSLTVAQFRTLKGEPDYRHINRLSFGGENDYAEVSFYITNSSGVSLLHENREIRKVSPMREHIVTEASGKLTYRESSWKEINRDFWGSEFNLAAQTLHLVTIVEGHQPCDLRLAAGQGTKEDPYQQAGEFLFSANPGFQMFTFSTNDFRTLRGAPDYSKITYLSLGGKNKDVDLTFYLTNDLGEPLLKSSRQPAFNLRHAHSTAMGQLSYTESVWKDIESRFESHTPLDLSSETIHIVTVVKGSSCYLRLAAGQEMTGDLQLGEFWLTAEPGYSVFALTTDQLQTLRGQPDYSKVDFVSFGGENRDAEVTFFLTTNLGESLLCSEPEVVER